VTYDARGQAVYTDESGKINDLGKETQFAYDAFGELIARGGKEGSSTSLGWQEYFDYDNGGRLWRSNGKDGVNKVMLYDLQGNFTADIHSNSVDLHAQASAASVDALAGIRRVVSRFDALGRVTQQDLANGASVYQTWDRWGNRLSVSDARNASWISSYTYNSNNQVTRETLPAASTVGSDFKSDTLVSPVTDYFYDRAGNLVMQRDARGNVSRKSWDAMGNLLAEFNANGSAVRHYYDVFNQEVTRVDALGNATGYAYDKMGRLTMVTRAAAQYFGINAASYDASASPAASPVTLFDNTGMGGATSYFGAGTYTGLTKTFSSIQVLAGWTISLYGDNNQIKTYPTAGTNINTDLPANMDGHVIKLVVTHQGGSEARVDQVLNDVTQLSYVYDELGRRLACTDARGASGATYYTYNLAGNITGVMKPGETSYSTQYQYDNAGYKSGETDALNNTMSWTNDYFGRAQSHGTLDGKVGSPGPEQAAECASEWLAGKGQCTAKAGAPHPGCRRHHQNIWRRQKGQKECV
jgi:YD repeat-containing protein